MPLMARILSIEDDAELQHLIGYALYANGYEVHYAFNGQEGYEKILALKPDLVLLDLMLPMMNGIDVLKKVKANRALGDIPVIVLTAYGDEVSMLEHSVKALGALEYLRKPVGIQELLSRIRAVLAANPAHAAAPPPDGAEVRKGAVRADPRFRTVWVNDRLVATLPHKRFGLLRLLLEASGPVSKEALLKELWGSATGINALEKAIQRLREDLGAEEGRRIQTSPAGYEIVG